MSCYFTKERPIKMNFFCDEVKCTFLLFKAIDSTFLFSGNDAISYITDQGTYELRVDLEDHDNEVRYAVYTSK